MNDRQAAQRETGTLPKGVVDLEERNWLPRHCRGDEAAFGELLLAYRSLVFTFLHRYGIDAHARDDLYQEIFLKIHQSASRYRPSEPLRPWVVSIALNTVRNFRRDRGRQERFMGQFAVQAGGREGRGAAQPGLDVQAEQQSTLQWLEERIGALPERQREVLVLSTLKGLRLKDVAKVLALPENTVKTHLRRARLALAESLARREARREESHERL